MSKKLIDSHHYKGNELSKFEKVENHYQKPQDIEWAIDKQGKIWILQSRPVTTL